MNRANSAAVILLPLQVVKLRFQTVIGTIKPIPFSRSPVNTKRRAHSVAKFLWTQLILSRKHLNSLRQSRASLDWQFEAKSEVVDVHSAVSCQQWLGGKDPEMGAAARLF